MVQEIRKSLPYQSAFCTLKRKYPPKTKKIHILDIKKISILYPMTIKTVL